MKSLVLILCVCLLLVAGSASGESGTKLLISHVCTTTDGSTEYHFVAQGLDYDLAESTVVEFYGTRNGVEFPPMIAEFTKTTGNASHYTMLVDPPAPITVTITAAVLIMPDLTLTLENPKTFETVGMCETITAVGLMEFKAITVSWLDRLHAWLENINGIFDN